MKTINREKDKKKLVLNIELKAAKLPTKTIFIILNEFTSE